MTHSVYITENFEKEIAKLSEAEKEIIQKIFVQLKKILMSEIQLSINFLEKKEWAKSEFIILFMMIYLRFWSWHLEGKKPNKKLSTK